MLPTSEYAMAPSQSLTGVVEHLSCFLPGLLALDAHLLPLDNLHSVGINYVGLAVGISPREREGQIKLSRYDLRKLHIWAAKGLTETWYLTYTDQPSGQLQGSVQRIFYSSTVMCVWRMWRENGGRSPVPGLRRKKPVVIPYESEAKYEKHVQMYYWTRVGAYVLRPEVSQQFLEDFGQN